MKYTHAYFSSVSVAWIFMEAWWSSLGEPAPFCLMVSCSKWIIYSRIILSIFLLQIYISFPIFKTCIASCSTPVHISALFSSVFHIKSKRPRRKVFCDQISWRKPHSMYSTYKFTFYLIIIKTLRRLTERNMSKTLFTQHVQDLRYFKIETC